MPVKRNPPAQRIECVTSGHMRSRGVGRFKAGIAGPSMAAIASVYGFEKIFKNSNHPWASVAPLQPIQMCRCRWANNRSAKRRR
jgi:hypothetical protein